MDNSRLTTEDEAFAIAISRLKADKGIRSSAEHAGPTWLDMAVNMVWRYRDHLYDVGQPDYVFTMETMREWATAMGLPDPPELRAWGSVTQQAIRWNLIKPTGGYAPTKSSNGSIKRLYRAVRP